MRLAVAILILSALAFCQPTPKRIPPDEAAKHLVNKPPAKYPPMAEAARIQGNVIVEVSIDETGAARARRLVIGHPMLAPAAIESVSHWQYQPFEVDGRPATVVTVAMVTFGRPGKQNDAAAQAEVLFQNDFWTAQESAQAALREKDYAAAQQQQKTAQDLLAPVSDGRRHEAERWQWMITSGRLSVAEQKYDDAESFYKKAQELCTAGDKDAPEMAATLAEFGGLYAEEKRYDLARENANRSIDIYQKNLKRIGSSNSGAREAYGRAIAYQSWMLSKSALQQNDRLEGAKQCRNVLDFQAFLAAVDHDSAVSACEKSINSPSPK
jgi:TonB family protein